MQQQAPATLDNYIRYYDGAMPATVCERLVDTFEKFSEHQIRNGSNARSGLEQSSWTEMDIGKLANRELKQQFHQWIQQYKARYENDCGLEPPLPDASGYAQLIVKRYNNDGQEQFQPHFDSLRDVCNRYLVILWYLNDVAEGGETAFTDLGIKVAPRQGRLLMFPPYWMYMHTGMPPVSNPKYILSTYLLW
ncbi:MAG: hypothetical protein Tsb002_17230 [Wenzhouxiangellaceae bacterium]